MPDVRDLLEKWARWRVHRTKALLGWPKRDSLGRLMSGVPGTGCPTCSGKGKWRPAPGSPAVTCPTCSGAGRVSMEQSVARTVTRKCIKCGKKEKEEKPGEINYGTKEHPQVRTCPFCRGSGVRSETFFKVNPASIPSTRHMQELDDPMSVRIDRLIVTVLDAEEREVIMWEYTRLGNQNQKISRLHITHQTYNERRFSAEDKIAQGLTL